MTEGRDNVEATDSRCESHAATVDAARAAIDVGDVTCAVATVLARYGHEIFGFLVAALADVATARDLYDSFVVELRRSLPGFTWTCELRTFAYFIARRQLRRNREHARYARANAVSLISARHLHRGASRSAVVAVRRCLGSEDRELLVLYFDRGFDWHDLAVTSLGDHATKPEIDCESSHLQRRILALRMEVKRIARRAVAHSGYRYE